MTSPPRHSFTFGFDRAFVRRALRRDRDWASVKIALCFAVITPLLSFGLRTTSPLFFGVLAGGFVATEAVILLAFRKAGERVLALWQRQSPSGRIRYDLDDDGFTITMDHANSRFAWQGLRRLWRYPDVWLIEIVRQQSAFFPPDAATPEALDFVAQRCERAGVRT